MPKREHHYWVYILSNRSHTLYIGVTNNLRARVTQHRQQTPGTHTARYRINRLVYTEFYKDVSNAIAREKELKHWTRAQKIGLIESTNPTWEELMPYEPEAAVATSNADSVGNDKQECSSKGQRITAPQCLALAFPFAASFSCCRSRRESAFCPKRHNRP